MEVPRLPLKWHYFCKQTHVCWYDKSSGKMQFREYSEQQKLEILEEKDQISTQLIDHWLVKQLSKLMEYWTCQKITYWWNNCPNSVNWNCKIWHQCCTISMLQLNIKSGRITSYNKRHWIWIYQNQWDVQISDSSVWKERKNLTPTITKIDVERIVKYFNHHITAPEPKCLQRHMLFYIKHYFCRRGHESQTTMIKTNSSW